MHHQITELRATLSEIDPSIVELINHEGVRQEDHIELIASENYAPRAVMEAQGSLLTNKYAEGYPGNRYYGGCEHIDKLEQLAIDRANALFGSCYANVQPHSGAQANTAVLLAFAQAGDTLMGMSLDQGGHLTHGSPVNISGRLFNFVHYGLNEAGGIDYDNAALLARKHRPKIIIGGFSAYSGIVDWQRLRTIADAVNATFMVDMAHIAGLVAGGAYPNPVPHAHVVTSTTHKSLRGPRGGIILSSNPDKAVHRKLNSAVFPCVQGGPLEHVIAAKAVCFGLAGRQEFKDYAHAVVTNAHHLAKSVIDHGLKVISNGTQNHLFMIDLSETGIDGKVAQELFDEAYITLNKNAIPNDTGTPARPFGIRVGTPAVTTRGFGIDEMGKIGGWLHQLIADPRAETALAIRAEVEELCLRFPVYGD